MRESEKVVAILNGKKAAIYCRVDGGGSAETRRQVLEAQRCRLKRRAGERKIQIAAYYEDNGYSGNDLDRPGLAQLLADHRKGMFDAVLVVNRSRLYRGNSQGEPQWPFQIDSLNPLEHDMIQ